MIFRRWLTGLAILMLAGCSQQPPPPPVTAGGDVVVYPAAGVITMDAMRPRAEAVAVADGRIVAVGDMPDIRRSLGELDYQVDTRFEDKYLLPGFIEPHLHPFLAGVLLPMQWITVHDWHLPGRELRGVRGQDAYRARLKDLEAGLGGEDWLWTWGYHQLFHGEISRAELDALSPTRPIVVWHRSFHEIYLNSAAIEALAIDVAAAAAHEQVDIESGHFYETGLEVALPGLLPKLFEPQRYVAALRQARDVIRAGGITTVVDGAFGGLDLEREFGALVAAGWDTDLTPYRTFLLLDARTQGQRRTHGDVRKMVDFLPRRDRGKIRFLPRQVKLFADGAAYSQLMQMSEGYLDGHEGEWLMTPAQLEAAARVYWEAGFQIHVHVNGDKGMDAVLDILQRLQQENPRRDHRFTLHHVAYARPDQAQRLADLGALVQANPHYLWALADKYAEVGLGRRRASNMVPMNSVVRSGARLAFHSDFPMAPAQPLRLAWSAVTRMTAGGNVLAPNEQITVHEALRGITIDAAYQIGREGDFGSIEAGKLADFTVLEQDPYGIPAAALKDIPIWGTVFEGALFPLED